MRIQTLSLLTSALIDWNQRSIDKIELYCRQHKTVIEEWWVNAVHLMKLYTFADGFHVNIYITLQGKI